MEEEATAGVEVTSKEASSSGSEEVEEESSSVESEAEDNASVKSKELDERKSELRDEHNLSENVDTMAETSNLREETKSLDNERLQKDEEMTVVNDSNSEDFNSVKTSEVLSNEKPTTTVMFLEVPRILGNDVGEETSSFPEGSNPYLWDDASCEHLAHENLEFEQAEELVVEYDAHDEGLVRKKYEIII